MIALSFSSTYLCTFLFALVCSEEGEEKICICVNLKISFCFSRFQIMDEGKNIDDKGRNI